MILTNEELRKKSSSDFQDLVLAKVMNKLFSGKDSDVHRLVPNVREISRERPSYTLPKKEYLIIKPFPEENQIGISGIDVRFGRLVAWTDVVKQNVNRKDLLDLPHKILEPEEEFVLNSDSEGNRVYYVTSFEKFSLPSNLENLIDSKSTSGRVGAMSREVGHDVETGEMIAMVQPYAFPLKVICGETSLSQMVIRFRNSPYMEREKILSEKYVKFSGDGQSLQRNLTSRGLEMRFATDLIYRAKKCDVPIDMDAKNAVNPKDYWEKIEGNSKITLDAKTLYLLGSLGTIELGAACGLLSREEQVLTGTGTWGHFAGIFQPFWKGGVTMEVYGFSKTEIRRGDRAGVVLFDEVETENPREKYTGSYQNQKPPMLPKMFAELI